MAEETATWTLSKEDTLVEMRSERPCLYAVNTPEYSDRVKIVAALSEIATALDASFY